MIDRTNWLRFCRWYHSLHGIQQWLFKIGLLIFAVLFGLLVTHEPSERPRAQKIILNCDHCGTDPDRTMTYNEYMDQKEQEQKVWFGQEKKRIQQQIWDEHGRQRWCRNHPKDINCN